MNYQTVVANEELTEELVAYSSTQFATKYGVSKGTYFHWRKKLRQERPELFTQAEYEPQLPKDATLFRGYLLGKEQKIRLLEVLVKRAERGGLAPPQMCRKGRKMNLTMLRLSLKELLLWWPVKMITVENVYDILWMLLGKLHDKAMETENPIDDAIVAGIEYAINDRERLTVIVNYLKELVLGHEVCVIADYDQEETVAIDLCAVKDDNCEAGVSMQTIVALMKVILPILVDWLMDKEDEEK